MFSIIITAGGIGKRMGSEIPKQFLEINGLPILMKTIQAFYNFDSKCQIIVTLPEEWIGFWKELLKKKKFPICHEIVEGGKERYHSIQNAIVKSKYEIIGVHDGVRPFVNETTIKNCIRLTQEKGNAIPVLPLKESLRKILSNSSEALIRSEYVNVQTPQFFKKDILEKAYSIPFHSGITDDASLVEEAGFSIFLCEGNEENIKITSPFDMKIAGLL